jgi:hypothetical protein
LTPSHISENDKTPLNQLKPPEEASNPQTSPDQKRKKRADQNYAENNILQLQLKTRDCMSTGLQAYKWRSGKKKRKSESPFLRSAPKTTSHASKIWKKAKGQPPQNEGDIAHSPYHQYQPS